MLDATGKTTMLFEEDKDFEKAKKGTSVFAFRPQLNKQLMDTARERECKSEQG
jgi:hypothetical protein